MLKRSSASVLAAIGLLAPAGFGGPRSASDVATIRVDRERGDVVISGVYEGERNGPLTYELTVQRDGPAGTTATRQAGALERRAARPMTTGFVRINVRDQDRLAVRLVVREGDVVVAEASREGTVPNI